MRLATVLSFLFALAITEILHTEAARAQVTIEEGVTVNSARERALASTPDDACEEPDIEGYVSLNLALPAYGVKRVWLEDECEILGAGDGPVTVQIRANEEDAPLAAHLSETGSNFGTQQLTVTTFFDEDHEASAFVIANTPTASAQGPNAEHVRVTATYAGNSYVRTLDVVPIRFDVGSVVGRVKQGSGRKAELELYVDPPEFWECRTPNCFRRLYLHPSVEVEFQLPDRADALGTLYGPDGSGRTVTARYDEVDPFGSSVRYKADGPKDADAALHPVPTNVLAQPLVGDGSVYYTQDERADLRIGGYEYDVDLAADTVAYGDSTFYTVRPVYADGAPVDLPFETGVVERGVQRMRVYWGGPPPQASTVPDSPKPPALAALEALDERAAAVMAAPHVAGKRRSEPTARRARSPVGDAERTDVRRLRVKLPAGERARANSASRRTAAAAAAAAGGGGGGGTRAEPFVAEPIPTAERSAVPAGQQQSTSSGDYRSRDDCYLTPTPGTLVVPDTVDGERVQGLRNGEPVDISTACGEYGRPTISFVPYRATTSGEMRFVADQAKPGGVPRTVEILARTFDRATGEAQVVVAPSAYLAVSTDKDTVAAGRITRVTAEASDAEAPDFDPNFTVDLSVSDTTVGALRRQQQGGDGWQTTGSGPTLDAVPYTALDPNFGDGSERVVFAARPPDDSVQTARITAARSDDPGKQGSTTVTVRQQAYTLELAYDADPATYLPEKGDRIRATATITPAPPEGSEVTFEFTQADDFAFADSTTAPKTVPVSGDTASVELKSLTYWGVVKVEATFAPEDGEAVTATGRQLPIDTDADGIADSWERDNGGTAIGGNAQDGSWDAETSPGNSNDGDSITKWEEYQGVLIGGAHQRLTPLKKEVFTNSSGAAEGSFALAGLQSLGLKVIEFGTNSLKHFADKTSPPYPRRLTIVDQGIKSSKDNGIFYRNGNPTGLGNLGLGVTVPYKPIVYGTAALTCKVFDQTIDNFFNANTAPEGTKNVYRFAPVLTSAGPQEYMAFFDGSTDLNGDGTMGSANPFDLMVPVYSGTPTVSNNAPYDGVIFALSQTEMLQRTTRHEAGHGVSILHNNQRGASSVMRDWIGPVLIDSFIPRDVGRMDL